LAAACAVIAILSVELAAAPGIAWADEAWEATKPTQNQPSLAPAPAKTNASAVSAAPSPSRWARVPAWQKVLGVGAILTGLAAVGTGAYLLWLDGQNACSPSATKPGGSSCAYPEHQTALAGWLLMAGGAAASLGGVTFLLVPPIGESRSHAAAGLALSARF
jgi:hypothetical protein